ncbi:MAG: hypothetical protein QF552_05255 [Litorilituus sp.]|nr:hypothetical protein [Litorilituus sp.]
MPHTNPKKPNNHELTLTSQKLLKCTLFSLAFAGIALITIILPAEYNIDPTGLGKKLGLTVFNNEKTTATSERLTNTTKKTTETIAVIVPPGRGVEYKFTMEQYQKLTYEWQTDSASLYFDLHGEPKGDTTGYFESYAIATLNEMKGSFTAPFSGSHGWYWKNNLDTQVTVQLTVIGEYTDHGLK